MSMHTSQGGAIRSYSFHDFGFSFCIIELLLMLSVCCITLGILLLTYLSYVQDTSMDFFFFFYVLSNVFLYFCLAGHFHNRIHVIRFFEAVPEIDKK